MEKNILCNARRYARDQPSFIAVGVLLATGPMLLSSSSSSISVSLLSPRRNDNIYLGEHRRRRTSKNTNETKTFLGKFVAQQIIAFEIEMFFFLF